MLDIALGVVTAASLSGLVVLCSWEWGLPKPRRPKALTPAEAARILARARVEHERRKVTNDLAFFDWDTDYTREQLRKHAQRQRYVQEREAHRPVVARNIPDKSERYDRNYCTDTNHLLEVKLGLAGVRALEGVGQIIGRGESWKITKP